MTDLTHRRGGVHPVDAMLPAPRLLTLGLQHVLVMYAGAIAVPLFLLFGEEALAYRLADCAAGALITDQAGVAKLAAIRDRLRRAAAPRA